MEIQTTGILKQIRELQAKDNSGSFSKGLFPSYRENKILGLKRPDDNIFFSASVVYILKTLYEHFTPEERVILKQIEKDLSPNFDLYTNKPERHSYNFWQKRKNKHFPNGKLLNKLTKFQLPDDIDTTSMVQIVAQTPLEKARLTKKVLPQHANGATYWIKNGHSGLRNFKAYSTWFGANMPIEFDVCVLSNYLLWVNHYRFNISENDRETIKLIKETINHSLYFKSGFKSAPEYPRIEVILYHLARLAAQTPYIGDTSEKLSEDIFIQHDRTTCPFGKMILQSSLIKLGENAPLLAPDTFPLEQNQWWFTAGLLSVYANPIIEKIATHPIVHFRFTCEAFNLALHLENQILTERGKNQEKHCLQQAYKKTR